MFSEALQAQIDLASGKSKSTKETPNKNPHSATRLDAQIDQVNAGKAKARFDDVSNNWVELGYTTQLEAELAFLSEGDNKQRQDYQAEIVSRRQRRSGGLKDNTLEGDPHYSSLSPSEKIGYKRNQRGRERMSVGLTFSDLE